MAAIVTTLGWVPQVLKVALLIGSWPVIAANGASLLFVLSIIGMKLRFG